MTATETTVLNEAAWHGKAFTGSWTAAAGGMADVIKNKASARPF
jgi:hypothetical protein